MQPQQKYYHYLPATYNWARPYLRSMEASNYYSSSNDFRKPYAKSMGTLKEQTNFPQTNNRKMMISKDNHKRVFLADFSPCRDENEETALILTK